MIPLVELAWHAATGSLQPRFERAGLAILVIVTMLLVVPKRNESCIVSNLRAGRGDFVCDRSSSGNLGPRLKLAYQYDLAFIDEGGLPVRPGQ